MKRVHIFGSSGNTEIAEISISGDCSMYGEYTRRQIVRNAEEAARVFYNRLPGFAWKAFVAMVNHLDTTDPYANM